MPEVINRHRLAELSEGDIEFEQELLEAFLEDARSCCQQLQEAIAAGDWDTISSVAHQLKGASGNVGAEVVAVLCRGIEEQTKTQTPVTVDGLQGALDAIATVLASDFS